MNPYNMLDGGPVVIKGTSLEAVYDTALRFIWTSGNRRVDQRGDVTRETMELITHISTDIIDYPSFGPTNIRYGDNFARGLIDFRTAFQKHLDFDYSYGFNIRLNLALYRAIVQLRDNHGTRRVTIPIYVPNNLEDAQNGKEVPCATQMNLSIRDNKLAMYLTMRSNDIAGAYPSDVYGFRCLQKYIAEQVGVEMGTFTHHAQSAHIIEANDADFMLNFMKTPPVRNAARLCV